MASKAAARLLEQKKQQQAEIRARLAKAKATSTKEKFDFKAFAKLYDVTQDYGSAPVTPEMMERYEGEYYLGSIEASTIKDFAARKQELKLHDAT